MLDLSPFETFPHFPVLFEITLFPPLFYDPDDISTQKSMHLLSGFETVVGNRTCQSENRSQT